jgi:hypothetical protein
MQVMEKEYTEHDFDDDHDSPDLSGDDSDSAPDIITTHEDFESMMDNFQNNYKLIKQKMEEICSQRNVQTAIFLFIVSPSLTLPIDFYALIL